MLGEGRVGVELNCRSTPPQEEGRGRVLLRGVFQAGECAKALGQAVLSKEPGQMHAGSSRESAAVMGPEYVGLVHPRKGCRLAGPGWKPGPASERGGAG